MQKGHSGHSTFWYAAHTQSIPCPSSHLVSYRLAAFMKHASISTIAMAQSSVLMVVHTTFSATSTISQALFLNCHKSRALKSCTRMISDALKYLEQKETSAMCINGSMK